MGNLRKFNIPFHVCAKYAFIKVLQYKDSTAPLKHTLEISLYWRTQSCTSLCIQLSGTVQTFNYCTGRQDVCQCLVAKTSTDNISKNKPSISMTHVAWESILCSVVRSSMQPCPGWQFGRAVVLYAMVAQALSAGIKCWHCIS